MITEARVIGVEIPPDDNFGYTIIENVLKSRGLMYSRNWYGPFSIVLNKNLKSRLEKTYGGGGFKDEDGVSIPDRSVIQRILSIDGITSFAWSSKPGCFLVDMGK